MQILAQCIVTPVVSLIYFNDCLNYEVCAYFLCKFKSDLVLLLSNVCVISPLVKIIVTLILGLCV